MARDNENALAGLQKEVTLFQRKLEKVQVEASTGSAYGAPPTAVAVPAKISSRIRSRQPFGVLLFDLNKFKGINDTLGHAAGDAVLKCVAQRLSSHIASDGLVCRWGGDEFVIVHSGSAEELAVVGKQITREISGTFSIKLNGINHDVTVGAEFGWANYHDGETPEQLLARADAILYDTKAPQLKQGTAAPAASTADPATGLPRIEVLESQLVNLQGDRANWFLGCFAIRSAARVNNHYGFPATDTVLPFLRDELIKSKFGDCLFRGRGSSLLALVISPGGPEGLETDLAQDLQYRSGEVPRAEAPRLHTADRGRRQTFCRAQSRYSSTDERLRRFSTGRRRAPGSGQRSSRRGASSFSA